MTQKLLIASDHGGFALKEKLVKNYSLTPVEWIDLGVNSATADESHEYADMVKIFAEALKAGKAEKGVLICGSGIGISIAANRIKGIRAGHCQDVTQARLGRLDNDINVIVFGERLIGELTARDCLQAFLTTEFAGGRHARRVNKIDSLCGL